MRVDSDFEPIVCIVSCVVNIVKLGIISIWQCLKCYSHIQMWQHIQSIAMRNTGSHDDILKIYVIVWHAIFIFVLKCLVNCTLYHDMI